MKRCSTITSECIWRHTFRKQLPERLGVTVECGMVYGCHRVRPREQLPEEGRIGSPGELKGTLGCEARAGQTTREQLLRARPREALFMDSAAKTSRRAVRDHAIGAAVAYWPKAAAAADS